MNSLIRLLMENGLLQFGWFEPGGMPFRLNLDMLPAYPDVLKEVISAAKPYADGMSRLICTMDTLPLGVGLSLETNISLVYSRDSTEAPFHDLVGAYDTDHPTLLLVNILDNTESTIKLILKARNVGLQIHHMLAFIDLGIARLPSDIKLHSLINFDGEIEALMTEGRLTVRHGHTVIDWLNSKSSG
jgi:hypothetical protein